MKIKRLFVIFVAMLCSFAFVLSGCKTQDDGNKVTVGFDLNFRTLADDPENIQVTAGKPYGELPEVEVENEGYTFLEWNTKANGKGDTITEDSIVSATKGDHTLYAIWEGKTYTVSYELNGGTINGATTLDPQTVTFGKMYGAMVIPNDPEKPLSEFLGWYLNPDGTGAPVSYSSDVRTAKDHTLYAIYRELRETYDFSTPNQLSDFVNVDHAGMEIVEDENGNYLKLTPVNFEASTPAKDLYSILMLKTPLKAGKVVEVDCEVVGEIVDAWGFWSWGAVSTGEVQFNGQTVTKWETPALWNNGKFTSTTVITENCAGLRMQFRYVGNAEAYWKITSIRIKDAGDTPITPPVVEDRTEFDFSTSEQINYFDKAKNVTYSIVEDENGNYLKVSGVEGSANTLMLKSELKAGMKVTVDVEYVGENLAYAEGNQITFLTYGSNINGDADGNTYAVIGNAKWDGGWDCAKVRTVSEITADCAGLRMQFVFNADEGAYFKITNIKIYAEGEEVEQLPVVPDQPETPENPEIPDEPVVETRTEYDFSTADQINAFAKEKNVAYEIVDGYLKITKTADGECILVLVQELKAGMKVTVDVEYVANDVKFVNGVNQVTFLTYGSNVNGHSDGNIYVTMGSAPWDGGWDCAKVRTVSEITTDCAGLRMQFVFNAEAGAYFKITNVKIYAEGEEVEQLPVVPDQPETPENPEIPDEPVVETRTEYDFSTADQINAFAKEKNVAYEIVDGYLKITKTADGECILVLVQELKAGMKVTVDVEYVANDVKFVNGVNQVTFLTYGSNVNGHSDGNIYVTMGSAPWDGGWDCAKVRTVSEITTDCAGLRMQFVFNAEAGAYFKITNVKIYAEGEEVEQLPVAPEEPIVENRTEYDFTTEAQKAEFSSLNNGLVEINTNEGYLKLSPVDKTISDDNMPQAEFLFSKALTAGLKVEIEFELVGTIVVKHGIWMYGVNENGHNLFNSSYYTAWDTPDEWNKGKFTAVFEATQDCSGIKFLVRFAKNPDAYWKISSIKIVDPTQEAPVEERTQYDFTTADQIDDFGKEKNVTYEIVDGYLKVVGQASSNDNFLVFSKELKAGQKVEIDVEYVGENLAYSDGQITFLAYTANANGDADGKTTAVIGNAKWDGGWDCAQTTVTVEVTQDCNGIRMQFVMNAEASAYFKITAIRIVDAE